MLSEALNLILIHAIITCLQHSTQGRRYEQHFYLLQPG
jgi:hypothetical protein